MISICMAYYNRKKQLYKTIQSINESVVKDYELIIVDDGSVESEKLDQSELRAMTNDNTILLEVDTSKKTWYNSCIAFNIAFSVANGDKIIYQNPECYHLGDVLNFVNTYLNDSFYFSFATMGLNQPHTNIILNSNNIAEASSNIQHVINDTNYLYAGQSPDNGNTIWYNHFTYRPVYYHFTAAITKNNLYTLGGFDERYKDDTAWDDNEMLARIDRIHLNKHIIPDPIVLHMYHTPTYINSPLGGTQNCGLYYNTTLKESATKIQELDFNNYSGYLK